MANARATAPVARRLSGAAAVLLLSWSAWTTNELADPLHGISRSDLGLVGDVAIVVLQEASMLWGPSGPVEGGRFTKETMTFGKDGLLSEWVQHGVQGLASTRDYTYTDGLLTKEEAHRPSGLLSEQITYAHEEGGKRTTAEVRSGTKALRKTIVYERDASGKLLSVTEYDAAGKLVSKIVYTYTSGGERADRYDAEGKLVSWSVKILGAKNLATKVALYSQGAEGSPFVITYQYDDRGNVTQEESSGELTLGFLVFTSPPVPTKTSYTYTYDDQGNWTKRLKSIWIAGGQDPHWQETTVNYRAFVYAK